MGKVRTAHRVQDPDYFEMNGCRNCLHHSMVEDEELSLYYCCLDGTGPPEGMVDVWDKAFLAWSDGHKVHPWGCCGSWELASCTL